MTASGNGDTVATLRARLQRTEQQASARQHQLERYAADLREVFKQERSRAQELRESYKATVQALSNAVEARDAYTGKHAERVTAYGIALARAAGLDTDRLPQIEFGFLLHDVGKVGVPDAILFKPGALSEDEFALIAQHPVIGSEILRDVDFLGEGKLVVRHHHERWDGTGYPDQLARRRHPARRARVRGGGHARRADDRSPVPPRHPVRARPRGDPRARRQPVRPGRDRRLRHDPGRHVRRPAGRERVTRTILIVDDDPMIRKLIATTLEDVSGYHLTEASNGAEAVEKAVEARPEIVFLDVDMPRVNGIEACRRLRSDPATASATIVMLTGDSGPQAERGALAAGADLFLTKPFSPLHLLRLVDRIGYARLIASRAA